MADLKQMFLERVQSYGCKNEDLAVNYFTRANNEISRLKVPKAWAQIDFEAFIVDVVTYANMGIDAFSPKSLYFIPRGNKLCIDLRFEAIEVLARKYGVNCPENITAELIYSNDKFSLIKKDLSNPKDGYLLQVTNPFDRGLICGGITVSEYSNPIYNKVRFMSITDINKRTSENTSFYKSYPEDMCTKTLLKHAWNRVTIDTTQINSALVTPIKEFIPENTEDLPFDPDAEL